MDPELKKLLEENIELTKENNKLLHRVRRNQLLSTGWTILLWIGALAIPFYLYHEYLKPVVTRFYGVATSTPSVLIFPASADLQKLINSYKVQ